MTRYAFVHASKAGHDVTVLCRLSKVSRSGFLLRDGPSRSGWRVIRTSTRSSVATVGPGRADALPRFAPVRAVRPG
jgi:hypothetical protein